MQLHEILPAYEHLSLTTSLVVSSNYLKSWYLLVPSLGSSELLPMNADQACNSIHGTATNYEGTISVSEKLAAVSIRDEMSTPVYVI
ncbi:unnamed protein product [Fusarium venenatum]|uniref:Uncharacterized protein n=1 Tax=Fusarium venenatum TaxID=56646 RepID=A0A2L2TBY8_9HYPO|nr:uncharacterized protein FVRRES_08579 [Fusarium venenatum]CEI68502.1 unnamed protein product [Fusarium venenatum]